MADRDFHKRLSQGIRHVELAFRITYVAGAPQFVEGDLQSAIAGSYITLTQTAVGVLTLKTKNPYPGFVGMQYGWSMAAPTGNGILNQGKPVQAADGTWSITVNTYQNAAGTHSALTPLNGDELHITLILRNSTVLP